LSLPSLSTGRTPTEAAWCITQITLNTWNAAGRSGSARWRGSGEAARRARAAVRGCQHQCGLSAAAVLHDEVIVTRAREAHRCHNRLQANHSAGHVQLIDATARVACLDAATMRARPIPRICSWSGVMPNDLSVWSMVLDASPSFRSWSACCCWHRLRRGDHFSQASGISRSRRGADQFESQFWSEGISRHSIATSRPRVGRAPACRASSSRDSVNSAAFDSLALPPICCSRCAALDARGANARDGAPRAQSGHPRDRRLHQSVRRPVRHRLGIMSAFHNLGTFSKPPWRPWHPASRRH